MWQSTGGKKSDITEGLNNNNMSFTIDTMGFPGGSVVKNLPANAGDARESGSIPK